MKHKTEWMSHWRANHPAEGVVACAPVNEAEPSSSAPHFTRVLDVLDRLHPEMPTVQAKVTHSVRALVEHQGLCVSEDAIRLAVKAHLSAEALPHRTTPQLVDDPGSLWPADQARPQSRAELMAQRQRFTRGWAGFMSKTWVTGLLLPALVTATLTGTGSIAVSLGGLWPLFPMVAGLPLCFNLCFRSWKMQTHKARLDRCVLDMEQQRTLSADPVSRAQIGACLNGPLAELLMGDSEVIAADHRKRHKQADKTLDATQLDRAMHDLFVRIPQGR